MIVINKRSCKTVRVSRTRDSCVALTINYKQSKQIWILLVSDSDGTLYMMISNKTNLDITSFRLRQSAYDNLKNNENKNIRSTCESLSISSIKVRSS